MGPALKLMERNRSLGLVTGYTGGVEESPPSQGGHLQDWIRFPLLYFGDTGLGKACPSPTHKELCFLWEIKTRSARGGILRWPDKMPLGSLGRELHGRDSCCTRRGPQSSVPQHPVNTDTWGAPAIPALSTQRLQLRAELTDAKRRIR